MSKILVVGLNPAWQKVLEFADFRPGEVNRVKTVSTLASGKGINAAKVLRRLGHEVWLLQILGGENGKRCLESCEELGIRSLYAWVETETRQCLTLLHGGAKAAGPGGNRDVAGGAAPGEATEIIEPFRVREAGVGEALLGVLPEEPDFFDAVVVSGTVPPGVGDDIYDAVLDRFAPGISVIDAWQGLSADTLGRATCVKMNQAEFRALTERLGPQSAGETLFLITSGGGEASMIRSGNTLARLVPPPLSEVVNPIGAGDTVTAGLTHFLLQGLKASEAFRRGLAMGSASCLHPLPAEFTDEDYLALLPRVELRR
jgi:fructose-1-phosphate kinase PfkB-like protein